MKLFSDAKRAVKYRRNNIFMTNVNPSTISNNYNSIIRSEKIKSKTKGQTASKNHLLQSWD